MRIYSADMHKLPAYRNVKGIWGHLIMAESRTGRWYVNVLVTWENNKHPAINIPLPIRDIKKLIVFWALNDRVVNGAGDKGHMKFKKGRSALMKSYELRLAKKGALTSPVMLQYMKQGKLDKEMQDAEKKARKEAKKEIRKTRKL